MELYHLYTERDLEKHKGFFALGIVIKPSRIGPYIKIC